MVKNNRMNLPTACYCLAAKARDINNNTNILILLVASMS